MGLQNSKKTIIHTTLVCIVLFSLPLISYRLNSSRNPISPSLNAAQEDNPTYIVCEIVRNQSVAWLNAFILFNITTDDAFTLYYSVYGIDSSVQIIIPDMAHEVNIESGTNLIKIPIKISLDAFPGVYYYDIHLIYFNSSSGDPVEQVLYSLSSAEIQVVMGFPLFLIAVGVLFTGLYIIFMKKINLRQEKTPAGTNSPPVSASATASVSTPVDINEVKPPAASSKPGYFKCPECKKDIKDGSAFCPECGYHIPKFLRKE